MFNKLGSQNDKHSFVKNYVMIHGMKSVNSPNEGDIATFTNDGIKWIPNPIAKIDAVGKPINKENK